MDSANCIAGRIDNAVVHPLAAAAALLAALIHTWFFVMESVWFMRPAIHVRFGLSSEDEARTVRSWAFNQGFYNLFLAVGVAIGLVLAVTGRPDVGRALVLFACGSMVAAGVVLVLHDSRLLRAGAVQVLPPLVAILGIALLG
jgi:putative membrane protein